MNRHFRVSLVFLAPAVSIALLASCSLFRWSGYGVRKDVGPEKTAHVVSTTPVEPAAVQNQDGTSFEIDTASRTPYSGKFSKQELDSLYYADLGPADIDVSEYPPQQKANYDVFQKKCSQCHTLARAVNSSTTNRRVWYYYIFKMRLHSVFEPGTKYTQDEAKQIYDFLVYDSYIRKVKDSESFEMITRRLQKRFAETIEERMRKLQHANQRPLLAPDKSR